MIGLFLFLVYFGLLVVFNAGIADAFLMSAQFLFYWYLAWSIIQGLFVAFSVFMGAGVGGFLGSLSAENQKDPVLQRLAGFCGLILGGTATVYVLLRFIVRRLLFVLGAYLWKTCGTVQGFVMALDGDRAITGTILIVTAAALCHFKLFGLRRFQTKFKENKKS